MTDVVDRIQSGRNELERLVARIPGFGGYKDKEDRRTADKLLRDSIARRLDDQRKRLTDVQAQTLKDGRLDLLGEMETANRRLNTAIDKLRTASYGYAGLFDAVKIQEPELDRLYNYDLTILDRVDHVEAAINDLDRALRGGAMPAQPSLAAAPATTEAPSTTPGETPAMAPANPEENLRAINDMLRDVIALVDQRHDILTSGQ